jgi:hypothetical protein
VGQCESRASAPLRQGSRVPSFSRRGPSSLGLNTTPPSQLPLDFCSEKLRFDLVYEADFNLVYAVQWFTTVLSRYILQSSEPLHAYRYPLTMPRQAKRPRAVVYLTADEAGSARPAKSPRNAPSSSSQPSVPGSSQPSILLSHLPSSSAAVPPSSYNEAERLSFQNPANDEAEPSTQDLTQSDDGPAHELYGHFGMHVLQENYVPMLTPDRRQDCGCTILQRRCYGWRSRCLQERALESGRPNMVSSQDRSPQS